MKKLSLIILLAVITVFTVGAQNSTGRGNTQLNAGVGFSGWGIPIYVGLDFGVDHDITLGLQASFRAYNEYDYNHSIIGFSGNGNYHFNRILDIPNNWDFYAGLSIGFYYWSSPQEYTGTNLSGLGLGAQIGGRYFFNNTFGLHLEFGGNNAWNAGGKFGITYRF